MTSFFLRHLLIFTVFLAFLGGCASSGPPRESNGNDEAANTEEAHRAITRSRLERVQRAIRAFNRDTGVYPDSLTELVKKPNNLDENDWNGPYLSHVPTDAWGRPVRFKNKKKRIELMSPGADGLKGGFGEDADIILKVPR